MVELMLVFRFGDLSPVPARGAYFIAFLGNDLVGSGALRPLDETICTD